MGDFATAVSKSERVAYGEDGTIAAGSFILSSAFPFANQGVQVGHVCVLKEFVVSSQSKTIGDVMVVTAASNGSLTLGRAGYPAGQGAFPGTGITYSAVKFFVPSLAAQITAQFTEIKRMLGVITPADLINPTDLKVITILKVLRPLYFAQSRQPNDDYWAKTMDCDKQIKAELDGLWRIYGEDTTQSMRPLAGCVPDPCDWRVPRDYGSDDWRKRGWPWIPEVY